MSLNRIALATALALAVPLAATPAQARNVVADTAQIAALLKALGRTAEVSEVSGKPYIKSKTAGDFTFLMFFAGCTSGSSGCKTIQLYAGFTPNRKPTQQQINDHARNNRWGRTYIDGDGDPVIEMDIDLEQGGMSEELFKDNIAYWDAAVKHFAEVIMPATK
jgi:Putative bacterial sensory transduction regulator